MKEILRKMLDRLEAIGEDHEELFDTEVRQAMSNAILDGFVRLEKNQAYKLPEYFGMFSEKANEEVKATIAHFIAEAKRRADELKICRFHDRLNAVQDESVTSLGGNDYDEFLGHSPPEYFDETGSVIRTH